MPLTPQYTWEEDVSSVAVHIPLKGVSRRDVDIYVSDLVIKVNFKPYMLLLDLHASIEHQDVTVKMKNGWIDMYLRKSTRISWNALTYQGSKEEILQRRKESMQRKEEYEQKCAELRKETKYANEKKTLRAQMSLEDTERQRLEDLKADEKQREENEMYRTFQQLHESAAAPKVPKRTTSMHGSNKSIPKVKNIQEPVILEAQNGIFDIPEEESEIDDTSSEENNAYEEHSLCDEEVVVDDQEVDVIYLPPPRELAQSKIIFTPRVFPTPSRESKAAEEEDWLLKNKKHLKSHKGLNAAAAAEDISDTDPVWLKAKGDDFYRHKDFRSAINAYGEALILDGMMTSCLSNRAACFLHVGEYKLCADDCTKALAQLPDRGDEAPSMHRIQMKLRLLVRRGTSYCQMGLYTEAKADYGVALTLHPQNEDLQLDFARIGILESCAASKKKGDECYARQDHAGAKQYYSEALKLDSTFISCLSNRAACHLALCEAQQCVEDCSHALAILEDTTPSSVPYSAIPVPGSTKRRDWVLKTLVRRGTAFILLKQWAKAEADYVDALSLSPDNQQLKEDLAHIRRQKQVP